MARAPRPGTGPSSAADEADKAIFKIVYRADTLTLDMRDVGAMDEEIFEAQTGKTFGDVIRKIDHPPHLAALVWYARRKRGERKLSYREVLKKFPGRVELGEMFEDGSFDIDVVSEDEVEEEPGPLQ